MSQPAQLAQPGPPPLSPIPFPLATSPAAAVASSTGPSAGGAGGAVRHYQPSSGAAFSRSAAKRHSVMALPSIEHLQHQYAKLGLTSSAILRRGTTRAPSAKAALIARQGWSILPGMRSNVTELSEEPDKLDEGWDPLHDLPPSPVKPAMDTRQPWEREGHREGRSVKGEKSLKMNVFSGLEMVCDRWSLVPSTSSRRRSSAFRRSAEFAVMPLSLSPTSGSFSPASDRARSPEPGGEATLHALAALGEDASASPGNLVYDLIRITTDAVRSVQNYVVALPPGALLEGDEPGPGQSTSPQKLAAEAEAVRLSTASRPRSSLGGATDQKDIKSSSMKPAGSAHQLRMAGLEVLGALKDLEHRYRLHTTRPAADRMGAQPETEEGDEDTPGFSASVSSGSLSGSGSAAPPAVGDPSEYDQDVKLSSLRKEADVVRQWVEVVDKVLLRRNLRPTAGLKRTTTLIESAQSSLAKGDRAVSASPDPPGATSATPPKVHLTDEHDESLSSNSELSSDGELPLWADPDAFSSSADGCLARAHILLAAHLTPELHTRLPDSPDRAELLYALSDGVLLCHAYNTVLRISSRPFGFIPRPDIHPLPPPLPFAEFQQQQEQLQQRGHAKEPTGSSVGAAAGEGEKVGQTFRRLENLRVFVAALRFRYHTVLAEGEWDVKRVARKEDGWDSMVEAVVGRWVAKAAEEKREELDED